MRKKLEYKTISTRARDQLARAEGLDVEFKRSAADLDAEDLIAFANSDSGGAILIGVEEATGTDGTQVGLIVGCPVHDKARQRIHSKAQSCIPPIELDVVVENLSRKPFLRIEIPPGKERPYSTAGGTYKIRGDGRNLPLIPARLLTMFAESESRHFLVRFGEATRGLEQELYEVRGELSEVLSEVAEAFSMAEESTSYAEAAYHGVDDVDRNVHRIDHKVSLILEKLGIENPDHAFRAAMIEELERIFKEEEDSDQAG